MELTNFAKKNADSIKPYSLQHQSLEPLPLKVLVVEDDKAQWLMWSHILHSLDREVKIDWETTQELAQALLIQAYHNDDPYDLVVSDIYLEGQGTGPDLWNKVGEAAEHFIFVTGTSLTESELKDQLNYGEPQFLKKPISISTCRKLIQDICELKKVGGKS